MAHRHLTEREQQVALPTDRQRLPDRAERTFDHREIPASAPKRTTPVSQSAAGRRGVSTYQRSLVWDIEGALAELKTQLRGAQVVLRSKTPDLVRQEFWGLLLAHFAVRGLMHEAALRADEDPDRLSFLHAVRVMRRKLPLLAAFPPSAQARPA